MKRLLTLLLATGLLLAGCSKAPEASTAGASAHGSVHRWHVLDNAAELAARGVVPAGTLLCVHGNPTWSYLWRDLIAAASDAELPWRVVAVDQLLPSTVYSRAV